MTFTPAPVPVCDDDDAKLLLHLTPGLGPVLTSRAVAQLGGATGVLGASAAQLQAVPGIGADRAVKLRQALDETIQSDALAREKETMARWGARALFLGRPGYPKLLSLIPDPPRVLYVRGELAIEDGVALGVVGSRRCTAYGREQADRLSAWCAQAGLVIVSGGAYGVDAAAHRAAMRVGGKTLIVLGSGLAKPYPADHATLFDQAASSGSAVLSELPMTAGPRAEHFPRRNRIISGLSLGVLVIEAAQRSGALITARLAAEDHGREVLALPGRVDSAASAGCHKILREGWAALVTNGPEILQSLGEAGQILQAHAPPEVAPPEMGDDPSTTSTSPTASTVTPTAGRSLFEQSLTDTQQRILAALDEPHPVETLAARTGLPVSRLQADLTLMQIRGVVTRQAGRFARAR